MGKGSRKEHRAVNYGSSDEKIFATSMNARKLRIKSMAGDGNCLFRAIADQVYGDSDEHPVVQKLLDYVMKDSNHFAAFFDDENEEGDRSFSDYCQRLQQDGQWGGNMELAAACEVYGVQIIVHQSGTNANAYCLQPSREAPDHTESLDTGGGPGIAIHISYHGDCHYNSVRQLGDPDDGQPAIEYPAGQESIPIPSAPAPGSIEVILAGLQALKVEQTQAGLSFKERKKAEILARKEAMKKTGMSKKDLKSAQRKNAKQVAASASASAARACNGEEEENALPSTVFI